MKCDAALCDLTDKVCFVTGANGGIGQSTVEHFVAQGGRVFATDRADRFSGSSKVSYRGFDLAAPSSLERCRDWIEECAPDVLFNNAAIFDMGSVLDAGLDQFDRLFAINVRALYAIMQTAANSMVNRSVPGSIINIASQAGHRGEALVAHYCATKAAVISYTQSAALALAPYGIRVNAISPGVIDTPMWDTVDSLFARFEHKQAGQKKREVGESVPLGFMGKPRDVARAAVFLACEQSAYMTAQTIGVDGGNVLR